MQQRIDKPPLQEEKSRKNGDSRHISELQQRLADCTSLDFDLHRGCICLRRNDSFVLYYVLLFNEMQETKRKPALWKTDSNELKSHVTLYTMIHYLKRRIPVTSVVNVQSAKVLIKQN
ncbi:hypothetical protein T4D_10374 [Trichinella pseudospiralis]|uniref:Uncharacterized protein n=1 Tax=Trichinella pseudospiralis TaxID=6337 RepID=A0A0V1FH24_TRIPS|nr:hypothetical protein T4D_10374 [Trichinella pseudospiralis]